MNPLNPAEWKTLPLPVYPAPQVVHTRDSISVDLWVNPDTGQKLVDYISFQPPQGFLISAGPITRTVPTVPTVSGVARDFSAEDAEMRLVQPRITMNGAPQDTTPSRAARECNGHAGLVPSARSRPLYSISRTASGFGLLSRRVKYEEERSPSRSATATNSRWNPTRQLQPATLLTFFMCCTTLTGNRRPKPSVATFKPAPRLREKSRS